MSRETWKPVVGFEGYYDVSSAGRIRSVDRTVRAGKSLRVLKGKLRTTTKAKRDPYTQVTLSRDGIKTSERVHSLVAEAFIGPRPEGQQVAHNDGNGSNNRADNLRYATVRDNANDKRKHGTMLLGECSGRSKITNAEALAIMTLAEDHSQREIADAFGVTRYCVYSICKGQAWGHLLAA